MSVRFGRRFASASEGATAIEFAFIAPILFFMIMGVLEFSMVTYATAVVEGASENAARMGKTGYTASGMTRQNYIASIVQTRIAGVLDPTKVVVTSKSYGAFSNIGQPEPYTDSNHNGLYNIGEPYSDVNGNGQWDSDMGSAGLGAANDIVVYKVSYPWSIVTPILRNVLGTNGVVTISSNVVIKNEPYNIVSGR